MKFMQIATVAVTIVSFLSPFRAVSQINWLTAVSDGYYNDAASWTGGVIPTNAAVGYITGNQDYIIRFPAGGLTENSVTRVGRLSNGRSVTFDTTGTWWLKSGPDAWPNDWTAFQLQDLNGSHMFNIEGVKKTAANDFPVILMSNAIFRIQSHSTSITNVLEQGLLNFYDPGGVINTAHSLITGAASTRSVIVFKTNSTLRANLIQLRGSYPEHILRFEGGNHELCRGISAGGTATLAGRTNIIQVAGGRVSIPNGAVYISSGKAGSHGALILSGSGVMSSREQIIFAHTTGTSSSLELSGIASLSTGSYMDTASGSSSTSTVAITESASLSVTGKLAVARGSSTSATMTLRDQSTTYVGGDLLIGGYSGSDGTLSLQDDASLIVTANYCTVGENSGTGRLELIGGQLTAAKVRGTASGWSQLYADGGTVLAGNTSPSIALLQDFDIAELGDNGLTVDSAGANILINQNFIDADSAAGLFVKSGSGRLSVSSSSHARTIVAEGELLLTDPTPQFGRSLIITNGTSLSLEGAAATLTAGDLTIGTTTGIAFLRLDPADSITVTNSSGLTINRCGIYFNSAANNGTYTLFRSTGATINSAALDNLMVVNPAIAKGYTFAIIPDGTDSTIQLTISDYTIRDALWDGSEGTDWNTDANWTPAAIPGDGTFATFNSSAAEKTVNISSQATCTYLTFDSSSPYLLQGESLSVTAGGISNVLGSHTIAMPLTILGDFSFPTALASTTTVSGAITTYQSALIDKSGSGTMAVSGNNAGFGGKWSTVGGRLDFASTTAWGSANQSSDAIKVGAGTLTYSGNIPAAVSKNITTDPGNSTSAAIFETQGDLSVSGTLTAQSGIICKRGPGDLTLNIGNNTAVLSAGDGSGASNIAPSGTISFPENGDSPTTASGLGGFNVLEGTLRLKGNGPTVSIANQPHFGIVGGKITSCTAAPILELDNILMNQGKAGFHFIIGNGITSDSVATNPTLRLVNSAVFKPNTIRLGYGASTVCAPTLIMSNATANVSWQLDIGNNDQTHPIVRLTDGSYLNAEAGNQWGGGIYVYQNVDVIVSGNSTLSQNHPGGSFRFTDNRSSGTMRWTSGGTMRFAQFQGRNYLTTEGVNMIFDGGVMEPIASLYSYSTAADKQSFIIESGGLTVNTPAGVSHAFTFPLTGTGPLTKTGAGELIFAEGVTYTSPSATNSLGIPTTLTGLATGNYTGGTTVQQGTLTVSNGTIRSDAVIAINSGATLNLSDSTVVLSEISGTGTIANGALTAAYRCNVSETGNDNLAFDDITLPVGLTVTFDPAEGYSLTNRQVLAVATLSGTADLNLASWRSAKINNAMQATFSLENNTVYAEIGYFNGTTIIIR